MAARSLMARDPCSPFARHTRRSPLPAHTGWSALGVSATTDAEGLLVEVEIRREPEGSYVERKTFRGTDIDAILSQVRQDLDRRAQARPADDVLQEAIVGRVLATR